MSDYDRFKGWLIYTSGQVFGVSAVQRAMSVGLSKAGELVELALDDGLIKTLDVPYRFMHNVSTTKPVNN